MKLTTIILYIIAFSLSGNLFAGEKLPADYYISAPTPGKTIGFNLPKYFVSVVYHVKNGGSDAADGLTDATAWATIAKVNAAFSSMAAGNQILFKRGDTFIGTIRTNKNGSSGNEIIIGAYGTGSLPIITGALTLSSWTNAGGGVWYADATGVNKKLRVATINGYLQKIGRWPNSDSSTSGYLIASSRVVNTSLTGPALSSTVNWTGADVAIRTRNWKINVYPITNHSSGTITYSDPGGTSSDFNAGYGYFIQNDIRTLDRFGEWFLDTTTFRFSQFFGAANPSSYTIKVADYDTGIAINNAHIKVMDLQFEHFNKVAIQSKFQANLTASGCTINDCNNGIDFNGISQQMYYTNNTFVHLLNNGITTSNGSSAPQIITGNYMRDIASLPGMGEPGDGTYTAIQQGGNTATIQYNNLDSCGYIGIAFNGSNTNVSYNTVDTFCYVKDDGSGIYNGNGFTSTIWSNRVVSYNFVGNGIGAPNGAGAGTKANGYYFDAQTNNIYAFGNVAYNLPNGAGFFLHVASDITMRNNLLYNVKTGLKMDRSPGNNVLRNILYASNIVYATTSNLDYYNGTLNTPSTVSAQNDMRNIFTTLDSNYYNNAISTPFVWATSPTDGSISSPATLAQWKTIIAKEINSNAISDSAVSFYKNPSASTFPITFTGYSKKLVNGTAYSNSFTLPAWSGVLLFDNGTVITTSTTKLTGWKIYNGP